MNQVSWSDNLCTVGWTTIHGWFDKRDRDWLASMVDRHHFSATVSRESQARLESFNTPCPYYFDFPEDDKGKALLSALRIMGMPGRREMREHALARSGEIKFKEV